MSDFERNLAKYAEVIVKVAVNVQPGQRLLIGPTHGAFGAPPEAYELIRHIAATAYDAGARFVNVFYDDEELHRIRVQHAPQDTMDELPMGKYNTLYEYVDHGDATLSVYAPNPKLMGGLDPAKVKAKQAAHVQAARRIQARREETQQNGAIISPATQSWAQAVFPDAAPEDAKAMLWDAIFKACRVDLDDPIAAWEQHVNQLAGMCATLKGKQYTALHYTAPGTDLRVGLPQGHIWLGGSLETPEGVPFTPNVPTEEVFTLPHRDQAEGVVSATMPLNYMGSLIEGLTLRFEGGRVVEASAETGGEVLNDLLDLDEAARQLGEVALVPHSSPISQSGLLFYNTLYDENASCHLALGNAYRISLSGGSTMTAEEFTAAGGNQSMLHMDFMIGSAEMDIDGITASGEAEPVMRGGEWAFAV